MMGKDVLQVAKDFFLDLSVKEALPQAPQHVDQLSVGMARKKDLKPVMTEIRTISEDVLQIVSLLFQTGLVLVAPHLLPLHALRKQFQLHVETELSTTLKNVMTGTIIKMMAATTAR